jgi:cytidylate kinase
VIVTLSRQLGSEGESIAVRVAAALGLELVDRDFVHTAALAAGIDDDLLHRLMYEGQRTVANEILQSLGTPRSPTASAASASSPLLGVFAPMASAEATNLEEAAGAVGQVIKKIAARDNVLILGQGGRDLLQGERHACHVLVLAPVEMRVARIARSEGLTLTEARRRVRVSDHARADYLARYYNSRWIDPLLYHLVVNTGVTPPESAASLIVEAAKIVATA